MENSLANHTFFCIDAHTCGNPVRVVAGGAPALKGKNMSERRRHFLAEYDWIRTGLMFEPRGHDLMSGAILYPPTRPDCDAALLFIETSGCLPMCGHGTIGAATVIIERGLAPPREPGLLRLDTPAGPVEARYTLENGKVSSVSIRNVASYLAATDLEAECPELGKLTFDVGFGGNFYAIIDMQENYRGLGAYPLSQLIRISPGLREEINRRYPFVHPENDDIRGVSHILWPGEARHPGADARNAVFYGEKAIDRSPCGTGTSARMAQWAARQKLRVGDAFVHESVIGSLFRGRVLEAARVGEHPAIIPEITGWAKITGLNTIFIDEDDPYAHGFQVI